MGIWPLVVLVVSFLVFAFLGLPIFISMGLGALVYCTVFWSHSSFTTIAAEDGRISQQFRFPGGAFFLPGRRSDERRRHHAASGQLFHGA